MKSLFLVGAASIFTVGMTASLADAAALSDSPDAPTVLDTAALQFDAATAVRNSARGYRHRGGGMKHYRSGHHVRKGRIGHRRGYVRPIRGFRLPSTFIQPSYFIGNYSTYGLRAPSNGYRWSRYYDDAVLADQRGVVRDSVSNIDWDRYAQGYDAGYRAGQATYDSSVLYGDQRVMNSGTAVGDATTYRGDWDGSYRPDGSFAGEWEGTIQGRDGRVYEGEYNGRFIGQTDVAPVAGATYAAPYQRGYDPAAVTGGAYAPAPNYADRGYDNRVYDDREEELAYLAQCRESSGIGGAVVGGALGALAGNRIAGRGERLGGSLIGGGLGAVAGAAIEQRTDRCRQLLRKYGGRDAAYRDQYRGPQYQGPAYQVPGYGAGYGTGQVQQTYPGGWRGGYYYPTYSYQQQAPTVTTVVVQSQPVTTTTTTTYIDEEVVYDTPTVTKRRVKPAPKRIYKPRPAAAPLKGCQQAHC